LLKTIKGTSPQSGSNPEKFVKIPLLFLHHNMIPKPNFCIWRLLEIKVLANW